ncbi:exosortase family protein XrtG [Cellulosilyticum sp. I15G10I2]|uniref:exosortase family protein XrtG n=1 Tax=Cellulosilyticum sp. I15G10I2 TaxID=1892843 RepID=UPI00085C2A65|nr:exosortase family protein XrtG [Cellulosilyticum sp. I15G10I2]
MSILIGCVFILWLYLMTVFNRGKLHFFKFVFGAVGIFFFLMTFFEPYLVSLLSRLVTIAAGIIGDATGYYKTFHEYSLILISRNEETISLYIDYECSGVIEILAFISLLCFFPVYNILEKIAGCILGAFWIFMSNVLRLFIICSLVYYYGNNIFYFAHTLFGRIVFYTLSIILYFHVFTKAQIKRQKIGDVSYGDDI